LPLARLDAGDVVSHVFDALAQGFGGWLVTANVDFVQRSQIDAECAALYAEADLMVADGAPLVWASHLAGVPLPERVAGSDLVWLLAERAAAEGRSLYLLGGERDAGPRAAETLKARYPGLDIAGVSSPWLSLPPKEDELAPIVEEVKRLQPDVVYAALGSPKQEYVIRALRQALPQTWFMGCGISLSFISGDVPRAPLWMQRTGLEWLHRLLQEPGRLAHRYLLQNLPFTLRLLYGAARKSEA
jgi:N-acetylglucosaminyldiphosphoundecaprenol N-acetyl-beta-D-mannosaminyltransferase